MAGQLERSIDINKVSSCVTVYTIVLPHTYTKSYINLVISQFDLHPPYFCWFKALGGIWVQNK